MGQHLAENFVTAQCLHLIMNVAGEREEIWIGNHLSDFFKKEEN